MTISEKKAAFNSFLTARQQELEFFAYIKDLFDVGYQTDQAQIAADVQVAKDAVVDQIVSLQATIQTNEAELTTVYEAKKQGEADAQKKEAENKDTISILQSQVTSLEMGTVDRDNQIKDLKNRIEELEAQINQ